VKPRFDFFKRLLFRHADVLINADVGNPDSEHCF
jgi:hypothetical protein